MFLNMLAWAEMENLINDGEQGWELKAHINNKI